MATTEALTGARIPQDSDAPLGGTQISRAINDLASYALPRYGTTAARDAAYAAKGATLAQGMSCMVGARLYTYDGGWQSLPQHLGSGTSLPSSPTFGDTYFHTTYGCTMRYVLSAWRQADWARVADANARVDYVAALATSGLTMHNGFVVYESGSDRIYVCTDTAGTALQYVGGGTPPVKALSVLSGFQAASTSYFALGYYIDGSGLVHLQGTISATNAFGPGLSANAAVLPTEARPARTVAFAISTNTGTPGGCQITSDGGIKLSPNAQVAQGALFTLDGIAFNPTNAG